MTPVLAKGLRWTAIATGVVGYPVLAHYSATTSAATEMPALGVAVALAPSIILLGWLGWRALPRLALSGACLAAGGLLWLFWPMLERNFDWVYFLQHAGTNAALALSFGHTLGHGQQPLISRLAKSVRGTLPPAVARYTRQVTLAWTLFFTGITLVSIALFFLAPIAAWSLFANFLTLPLAVLMFASEYLIRLRRLPDERQHSMMAGVRAYWKTSGTSAEATPHGQ